MNHELEQKADERKFRFRIKLATNGGIFFQAFVATKTEALNRTMKVQGSEVGQFVKELQILRTPQGHPSGSNTQWETV